MTDVILLYLSLILLLICLSKTRWWKTVRNLIKIVGQIYASFHLVDTVVSFSSWARGVSTQTVFDIIHTHQALSNQSD